MIVDDGGPEPVKRAKERVEETDNLVDPAIKADTGVSWRGLYELVGEKPSCLC